jgi:hypothetical protein
MSRKQVCGGANEKGSVVVAETSEPERPMDPQGKPSSRPQAAAIQS